MKIPIPDLGKFEGNNQNNIEYHPHPLISIKFASILILFNYLLTFLFVVILPKSSNVILALLAVVGLLYNLFLSVAAVIGWNPRKIRFLRVVLMFILSIFPVFLWLPSFLTGKAIARKKNKSTTSNPSKIPVIVFGIVNIILALFLFSDIFYRYSTQSLTFNYAFYYDEEMYVGFEYPDFFTLYSDSHKERTEFGSIFKRKEIGAFSASPSAYFGIRILDIPLRDEMFPDLYPPDNKSLEILTISDLTGLEIIQDSLTSEKILDVAKNFKFRDVDGFPSAQYSFILTDSEIGESLVNGALIITDKYDVSVFFVASIEQNVEGSFKISLVNKIWNRIISSIDFL
jgi:hypothetical protein